MALPLGGAHVQAATHEQELEKRIELLEKRLAELEALLSDKQNSGVSRRPNRLAGQTTRRTPQPALNAGITVRPEVADDPAAGTAPQHVATDQPVAPAGPVTPEQHTAADRSADSNAVGTSRQSLAMSANADKEAPQELNVVRENTVTLSPKGVEVSTQLDYASRRTDLQQDRGVLSTTSVRYGVLPWLELSLTVPVGDTTRTTNIAPGRAVEENVTGLGDLLLQANMRIVEQTSDWPGVVFSLGAFLPTGRSPYNLANYKFDEPGLAPVPNPINLFGNYFSQGDWGLRTNLQFYKTVDPFILFFGLGIDHFLPQTIDGFTVSTGLRFHYNAGFSFAASEKTTLGFTLDGQYQQGIKVDGRSVFQSYTEPTLARVTMIQRVAKGTYLEPSISLGLTRDSPNFVLALGLRRRF